MKRFGLIGHPIAHSLSPALFKAGYSGKYSYDLIEGEDFGEAFRKFIDLYDGINVTAPFKELAFAKADILSEECRLIGATNLLVKERDIIKAYNSDYYGIALSIMAAVSGSDTAHHSTAIHDVAAKDDTMQQDIMAARKPHPDFPPRPSQRQMSEAIAGKAYTALVVGAGGAGKAAAVAAARLGLNTTLMNRTASKVEKIAAELPELNFSICGIEEFPEAFKDNDIIIYTLPGAIDGIMEIAEDMNSRTDSGYNWTDNRKGSQPRKYILEANYRNPVLKDIAGRQHGIAYIPGEQWLLFQAYAGYDLFTGEVPSLSAMAAMLSGR